MCQINPNQIVKEKVLILSPFSLISQIGIDCSVRNDILLKSKRFVNILLNESVKLPKEYFMTFNQRSSFSRQGVFTTTGIYDSGFEGAIGCSIYNMSDKDILILKNERIGQAIFWKADSASLYNGQFQGLGLKK